MNSNGMSVEPFNRLVKLAARAFYDDISTKGENQPKTGRSDNRGIAVVILDALTRRQWVREEDLAKDLKLHSKQLRRTLRFFEEEKLVTRDHRKETAKGAKIYSAAVAATADEYVGQAQPNKAQHPDSNPSYKHNHAAVNPTPKATTTLSTTTTRNPSNTAAPPRKRQTPSHPDSDPDEQPMKASRELHEALRPKTESTQEKNQWETSKLQTSPPPPTGNDLAVKQNRLHSRVKPAVDRGEIYDVVRYRLHRMRKKLKDELENKNTVQEYICPNCTKRYTALDALRLVSTEDEYFHCESCNGELVAESDKLAAQEMGDGDDNARRRRREKLKDMLQKLEVLEQLKPLMDQLSRVKDLPVPEFGNLHAWELRAAVRTGNGDFNANDASRSAQGFGGTPMPCVGETKVEVAFPGVDERGEDTKSENSNSAMKVLPPWMIKQGMNLTKEQRGEDEYVKAYYAAILQMQQKEAAKREHELSNTDISNGVYAKSDRQVGSKSKRDDNEGDEDIEWEEAAPTGNAGESYKVNDLNVEADASGDEDEDDIDWEEG
ncbi:hypothetical protein RHGRI_026934 [Rhododendron griersonianum]|uniref:HTH TFE/IIEalpha-type domain-containing protein n=1 Tax=Rhododendron griersonianum TaxID=479676 RepID=A0AAV6IUL7_9ERIC|nr:hypothetical protein RHGRI_026934 [Rhododendron griersonianum]